MKRKTLSIFVTMLLTLAAFTYIGIANPEKGILEKNSTWYAYNAYDESGAVDEGPFSFPATNPADVTLLAPGVSSSFMSGACFVNDTWYACELYSPPDYNDDLIWTINTTDGTMTSIGNYGIGDGLNGLAYDDSTHTLYGCSSTDLYTIDKTTGSATLVGSLGTSGLMIGLASDGNGTLYGVDLSDDSLYSIDPLTGTATLVGSTGLSLNYAQDIAFDKDNDTLYLSAFIYPLKSADSNLLCPDQLRYSGDLYECNVTDASTTYIGTFGVTEVTGFAIPYEYDLGPQPQEVMVSSLEEDWNIISLPFNYTVPKENLTVNYAGTNYTWNEAVTNGYISNFVFGWDRLGQSYFFADTFIPGEAYWVFVFDQCQLWLDNITIFEEIIETPFSENWNLMGMQTIDIIPKDNLTITYMGTDYTWADAVSNGYISDFFFGWNRIIQSYEFADTIYPGFGYWMFSSVDCTVNYQV